jgi:hypothetical protein
VRKKITMGIAAILVLPVVLVALLLVVERIRGKIRLAHVERQLVAQGVQLEARDFGLPPVQGENGAPEILAAAGRLKQGEALPDHNPPRMRVLPGGRAIVCFREDQWREEERLYNWKQVAADLASNAGTLDAIGLALEKPVLRNPVDFSRGYNIEFGHLAPVKGLAAWYAAAAQLALRNGDHELAVRHLTTLIRLPKLLAEDRLVISELVRIAIGAIARTAVWEALQAQGWEDGQLRTLQREWAAQEDLRSMIRALEGEIVFNRESFKMLRRSHEDTVRMLFWMDDFVKSEGLQESPDNIALETLPYGKELWNFLKKRVYVRLWRFAWLDQAEARALTEVHRLVQAAREAAGKGNLGLYHAATEQLAARSVERGIYDRLRYPEPLSEATLSRSTRRAFMAETDRGLTICAIALKRFGAARGKPPESLGELTPEFLAAVPVDYMDGKPMKYRLNAGGTFLLYSSGDNGLDDGGDTSTDSGEPSRNIWKQKDVIWPGPATAGETRDYRSREAVPGAPGRQ